ncbi:hypothetical protein BLA13014_00628 [Burkholderia aenigmatica]|uniref:Uncharacterized protein n=1 Tax=Burkholderia aenigmatica TaxID=2015348 RepID=A0A6P2HNQ4_9BURK|nr:hypothetical protein BLA13014_00628 [Burkholderia aenigmatica]
MRRLSAGPVGLPFPVFSLNAGAMQIASLRCHFAV